MGVGDLGVYGRVSVGCLCFYFRDLRCLKFEFRLWVGGVLRGKGKVGVFFLKK